MLDITKKYNQFKKSTYFAGGKFVIYATCVCLAATFAVGCLGLIIGFPLLTFPLAILISNPVVWVLMGIVVTAAYKMVVEPLFHLAKNYINGKRASKGEKSEEKDTELQDLQGKTPEKQARPKTPDRDSGVITPEIAIDNNSFLHQTEKEKNYNYKLTTTDIRDIVKSKYGWIAHKNKKGLKDTSEGVIFACPDSKSSLEQELKEYKNKVEREGSDLVFTSILNLNGNHCVTLGVSYDEKSEKFRACYCDSFGEPLPEEVSSALQKTLGIDNNNSSIRNSEAKQQKDGDTWNCGIFALENAKKITDMLKAGKSFDKIFDDQPKYEISPEQLIEKRKEFAKALKKDEQSRANTPSPVLGVPGNISRKDSGVSLDSVESKQTKIVQYNTTGDGNCFFHAVFGDNSSGQYKAEKAQDMRMEWHKFLSQFTSLDDPGIPAPLRGHLETLFNMFLNKPGDLTGRSDKIKKLVEQTNEKTRNAKDKVGELVGRIIRNFNVSHDKSISDLREYAEALDPDNFDEEIYKTKYNSDVITNSFLNNPELYKAYLEAINNPCYYIFINEIPILASLANIKINVYYKDNNNEKHEEFEPDPQMINDDQLNRVFGRESYKLNDELWGNKKQETIHLGGNHYERAEIVEVEPSLMEKANSALQGAAAARVNALGLNT